MMMGMFLMYSLLHPIDVQTVSVECAPYFKMQDTQLIQQNPTALALPQPHTAAAVKQADVLPLQEIHNVMNNQEQVHFQQDFNMLPALPNANVTNTELVLYEPIPNPPLQNNQNNNQAVEQGFSYLQMLEEDDDDMLLMAATQIEKNSAEINSISTATSTIVVKKSSPKLPMETAFVGCHIGSIGTVNIHIHNH